MQNAAIIRECTRRLELNCQNLNEDDPTSATIPTTNITVAEKLACIVIWSILELISFLSGIACNRKSRSKKETAKERYLRPGSGLCGLFGFR